MNHQASTPGRPGSAGCGVPPELQRARRLAVALGVEHVSLILFAGTEYRAVVRGSDADLTAFGDMGATVGEGPAHDVLRTGRPCVVEDLPARADRWPVLLSAYPVPDHLRSLMVVPVATDQDGSPEDVLGVVALAGIRRRSFTTSDVDCSTRAARDIAVALMARAGARDEGELDDDLRTLIDPHADVVPQAVGALSTREGVNRTEALDQLKTRAFLHGKTLQQVSHDLVTGYDGRGRRR